MARSTATHPISTLLFLFLLLSPSPSTAVSYTQLRTLFSLAHSLSSRVASLRSSRGDLSGARRAQLIADKLARGLGLGFWGFLWSVGWDYVRNYAWRDTASFPAFLGVAKDANELLGLISEFTGLESDGERAAWVSRNYKKALRLSKSMFNRLLTVFSKSGPLREMVETLKKEAEGDFLKDCLEVGSKDLQEEEEEEEEEAATFPIPQGLPP